MPTCASFGRTEARRPPSPRSFGAPPHTAQPHTARPGRIPPGVASGRHADAMYVPAPPEAPFFTSARRERRPTPLMKAQGLTTLPPISTPRSAAPFTARSDRGSPRSALYPPDETPKPKAGPDAPPSVAVEAADGSPTPARSARSAYARPPPYSPGRDIDRFDARRRRLYPDPEPESVTPARRSSTSSFAAEQPHFSAASSRAASARKRQTTKTVLQQAERAIYNDYHVFRTQFRLGLLDNLSAVQGMEELGAGELHRRVADLRRRYGQTALGTQRFHTYLELLLRRPVDQSESGTLFALFDANNSGVVDDEEIVLGIAATLQSRRQNLAAYAKRLTVNAHAMAGTAVALAEAEVLLQGIAALCRERFPEVVPAAQAAAVDLRRKAHHFQVTTAELCDVLRRTPVLNAALASIATDGSLPPVPTPPPTPDPDVDVLDPKARASSARGTPVDTALPASDAKPLTWDLGRQERRGTVAIDVAHPLFEADLCVDKTRRATLGQGMEEHENPKWFSRHGSVWCETDTLGAMVVS